ncbi:hypothetical protein [Burkholderia multivorans]|uniref:hypothetical protein n=1 Tax=Burkholderia multivorans TaxID=87883 RepID=UPI0020B17C7B|nr:hypothetical protein [Burkholderia multivorans]
MFFIACLLRAAADDGRQTAAGGPRIETVDRRMAHARNDRTSSLACSAEMAAQRQWRIAARGGRYAIARSPAGARCVVPRKDGSIAAAPALRAAIEPINWPCVPERGWMIGLPPNLPIRSVAHQSVYFACIARKCDIRRATS